MTFYRHLDHTHPSVTTVIGDMTSKPALINWAASQAASAALRGDDRPEQAHNRSSGAASERGNQIHRWLAAIARGQTLIPPEGTEPWCEQGQKVLYQLVDDGWAPAFVELSLVDCARGWAGTTDLVLTRDGSALILDWKTTLGVPKVYPEHQMQVAAYSLMPAILDRSTGRDTPKEWVIDHAAVAVLSPDACEVRYLTDLPEAQLGVRHLLAAYRWKQTL